jgi:HSP20 family molecular chaperone IbpA
LFREVDDFFDAFEKPRYYNVWGDVFQSPLLTFPTRSLVRQRNGGGSVVSKGSNDPPTSVMWPSWYEVHADKDKVRLAVDVPGIKRDNITLQLEQDGRVLRVLGERKLHEGKLKSEKKFEKLFALDKNTIDTDSISANLSNGMLLITLPRRASPESTTRLIPVTESAAEVGLPSAAVDESKTNISGALTTEETEVNLDDINVANDFSAFPH